MADPIRFIKELGLWAFSRGTKTCQWQTKWCAGHCYNKKFYRVNPKLTEVDTADELYWQEAEVEVFAKRIRALNVDRFRFAVRGEIWQNSADILTVRHILEQCPNTLFWIPTRAWRTMHMVRSIEEQVLRLPNARVMASIDPTTSEHVEALLKRSGWSTVFAGDNNDPRQLLLAPKANMELQEKRTARHVRCEKTWDHHTSACTVCKHGCFSPNRVDVHLKQHR